MKNSRAENQIETILRRRFARIQILESHSVNGEERLLLRRRHLLEALQFLRDDPDTQIDLLVDVSAFHHIDPKTSCIFSQLRPGPAFEVFYLLRSARLGYRLRISVLIAEELAFVPTISSVFQNANWLEREMWDLFGIVIEGHPLLRRLILYPLFEGHPLKKGYPLTGAQPQVSLKPNKGSA